MFNMFHTFQCGDTENHVGKMMDNASACFQKCFIYLLYHYKYTNAERGKWDLLIEKSA